MSLKNCQKNLVKDPLKFIYFEKATNFREIPPQICPNGQIDGGDFVKFCGLLRIYTVDR